MADESKWVSVKERVPDEFLFAWVMYPGSERPRLAFYNQDSVHPWTSAGSFAKFYDVSHWLPLDKPPEPPKPEDPGLTLEEVTRLIERRWPNMEKVTSFEFNYTTSTWSGRRATVIQSADAGS